MMKFVIVSLGGGVLFGVLDGLIHANPWAQRLYEVYRPIARSSVNAVAGVAIDLVYGFALGGLFLLLYKALPGTGGATKGLSLGLGVWFLRVAMRVASDWMMFQIPWQTLAYGAVSGLLEMLILGLFYGLTLGPGR